MKMVSMVWTTRQGWIVNSCPCLCAVKQETGQPVAVYPWHCLVPFLAASSTPATTQRQQQQQLTSLHPRDALPPHPAQSVTAASVTGMRCYSTVLEWS